MRKCPKKVNMSIFPVGYPEAVYKEIVNNSVQDPLQLTKIALYQIQDAELSSRNEIATTCVGIMCCWLVDTTEGTYNHFILIMITTESLYLGFLSSNFNISRYFHRIRV